MEAYERHAWEIGRRATYTYYPRKIYAAVGVKEEGHASDTDPRPGAHFETLEWDTGRTYAQHSC